MKSISFNPYIVGNPIKSREMFFGREDDFQYVVKKIGEGRSNQIIVLCGERRSGKTSILFQILGGRLGPLFLPILIDMQMLAGIKGDFEFFRAVFRAGCAALDLKAHDVEAVEAPAGTGGVDRLFEAFLSLAREKAPDKIVLFLLDEYELIEAKIRDESLSESTVHYLGGILESPFRVSFIFTGSTNLEDRKVEVWKSLLGKSIYRKISYLSRNDAFRLITEPLKDVVTYPGGLLGSIYRLTGGQPFYTQVICQNMVDLLMESQKNEPDASDLDRIVRDIVDNPLPQMIYSWNSVSEWDQIILSSLASRLAEPEMWADAGEIVRFIRDNRIILPFKKERVNVLLEEAYHKEFLEKSDSNSYRFKMDLFRKWIKREHSIWKAAKEAKLEFRKGLRPFFIAAAAVVAVLGAAFAVWRFVLPSLTKSAVAANTGSQGAGSAAESVADVSFKANRGPFRLQIDGTHTLTSEGQKNPLEIVVPSLAAGRHTLSAQLVGGETKTFAVDIAAGNAVFTVEFAKPAAKAAATLPAAPVPTEGAQAMASGAETPAEPAPSAAEEATGFLVINSRPPGADVMLDGTATGKRTPFAESVSAGAHSISLAMEGYRSLTETVRVERGGKTSPDLVLEPVWGEISFDVRPYAVIYLDGVKLTETPDKTKFKLQAGKHVISIVNDAKGVDKRIPVTVGEGESLFIQEDLNK